MPVHIALLRAINVGGTGALPMAELKAICEGLGFEDVKTYIQSGNVVFRSADSEKTAAEKLDAALGMRLSKKPGVMIRGRKEMAAIAGNAPFPMPSRASCWCISWPKQHPKTRSMRWWRLTVKRR
jgi:uncharacterized protein (DUF1697 family)